MGQISNICRACVPLICFATVEWHATDRVMRQFGLQQTIPQDAPKFDKLHKIDLSGKIKCNWPQKHEVWIQIICIGIYKLRGDGAYSVGAFNFATELMERKTSPQAYNNPIQTINYVRLVCKELVRALSDLNPTAFSTS
ncbi:hypothetical protein Lal_00021421 [Lupinus albus]|nr:hypothetical protein Lal_00021421 [Lupinus albus]